mgnify:FL=1
MKTVAKINPEEEYETAKKLIELASKQVLDGNNLTTLGSSVDNLITAARVLMDREERRRGHPSPPKDHKPKGRQKGDEREEAKKLPSKRFPNLEIEEQIILPATTPSCTCCGKEMKKSGLCDITEKLELIPKRYYIKRFIRPKFNCSHCHGSMINTPAEPSIVPLSNYGDSLIIDVALSKFLDLIPIERYAEMALRSGLFGELPAQSLIGLTHHCANFLTVIYDKIKLEVQASLLLMGDETPHKMLEGDDTKNWYLWGFFSTHGCYFETHNTRSGDIVFGFLKNAKTEYLLSDGYTGYAKAVRMIKEQFGKIIVEIHCNAHAYRYFEDASITWKEESEIFLKIYGEIYKLEQERKEVQGTASSEDQLEFRKKMLPLFEQIKSKCEEMLKNVMPESGLMKALKYFLNHYDGLTVCTTNIAIPLDNNLPERELRSPVVGRKTWLGTHSKRGALTTAVLFSIVSSCKINNINPRHYFPWIVGRLHRGEIAMTPFEYAQSLIPPPPSSG